MWLKNVALLTQHGGIAHLVRTHQELQPGADQVAAARVARIFKSLISIGKDFDRF